MNDNDKANKKCLKCVHCKVCEHIDDGIQMCCSGYDGCDFFEEKESRINFSERIKLVNKARNRAANEFAENLRKRAKPHYAVNNCFCVDVAEISTLEMQMLINTD